MYILNKIKTNEIVLSHNVHYSNLVNVSYSNTISNEEPRRRINKKGNKEKNYLLNEDVLTQI